MGGGNISVGGDEIMRPPNSHQGFPPMRHAGIYAGPTPRNSNTQLSQ
jgi:hypothetical protein